MAGKLSRMIGGRAYMRHDGEVDVAKKDRWVLVHVPEWSRDGWKSYKLFLDDAKARKKVWHLAHKDGRITGGAFITNLMENHPDALQWATWAIKECN